MIPSSTLYKLVDEGLNEIVAQGSAKAMRQELRHRQKANPDKHYFVGLTSKKVGEKWSAERRGE